MSQTQRHAYWNLRFEIPSKTNKCTSIFTTQNSKVKTIEADASHLFLLIYAFLLPCPLLLSFLNYSNIIDKTSTGASWTQLQKNIMETDILNLQTKTSLVKFRLKFHGTYAKSNHELSRKTTVFLHIKNQDIHTYMDSCWDNILLRQPTRKI